MIRKFMLLFAAFLTLLALRVAWTFDLGGHRPLAAEGLLDLRSVELGDRTVVPLRGEWAFYPGRLNAPKGPYPEADVRYVRVPGSWDNVAAGGKDAGPFGYGTYRLQVLLPEIAAEKLALQLQVVRTAHRLYVNGEPVGARGTPGRSAAETEPETQPYVVEIPKPADGMLELVLHVSNYDYARMGGLLQEPLIGASEAVHWQSFLRSTGDTMLSSFFAICALYFFFLYIFRRKKRELLYFSVFFWMSLLYWLTHGDRLLLELAPDISYNWFSKLQLLASLGVFYSLFLFICRMYEHSIPRWAMRAAGGAAGVLAAFVVATDVSIFTRLELALILFDVYLYAQYLYVLFSGLRQDPKEAVYTMASALCILLEGIFQLMSTSGYTPVGFYPPVEKVAFAVTMAVLIARRFFHSFDQIELLSQRLLAADRMKSEFLVNTSYELRLPLHGMINIAQVMKDEGALDPRQEERLALLLSTGRRLVHLLNELLDLDKLNAGTIELQAKPVDLRLTIGSVLEVMRHLSEGTAMRFDNRVSAGLPLVLADEQRLMQLLFHLIHLAVKSGRPGDVAIDARADGGQVHITLSGYAWAADEQEQPAEFSLDMCRKLVELHGSRLRINPGAAAVSFSLPAASDLLVIPDRRPPGLEIGYAAEAVAAAAAAPDSAAEPRPPAVQATAALRLGPEEEPRARVLLADGDPQSLRVMAELLASDGFQVTALTDGRQAEQELASRSDWDLVVVDVFVPHVTGYELCRRVRERYSYYELPVLFVTARSQPADLLVGFDAGANDFVTKPVDASELRARTRTLLQMKQSIQEKLHLEMALIQAQIKPHFLYNTLNTIASLSEVDPEGMRDLLTAFGRYLRSSFDLRNLDRTVPFAMEWTLVESYLEIERARFGARLQLHTDVPEHATFHLPPLTIQPIVENALRHGVLKRYEGGEVRIRVSEREDGVEVAIEDNGTGFPADKREAILNGTYRPGIGLVNVHRRLMAAYGEGLSIESAAGGGTLIRFRIPADKRNPKEVQR